MTARYISAEKVELDLVRKLSARIGSNPLLVQASTGNTSVKIDDILWIKASGKWLIQAEGDDFLAPVRLTEARRCLRDRIPIPETETNLSNGLSASIETAMHAVLNDDVVIHVHSVNTISWAVRRDAERQLQTRLSGFSWQFIPHTPSGTPLAMEIDRAMSHLRGTNVFVLGNHGLVVCGNCCSEAEELLYEVEHCLAIEPRSWPEPDYTRLTQTLPDSTWSLPRNKMIHGLGTNPISRRILSKGILYPCQAIFLPETTPLLHRSAHREILKITHHGVIVNKRMTRAEEETLVGLANIIQRIDTSARLRYLTASEVNDVLTGGGESYRQVSDLNYHPAV